MKNVSTNLQLKSHSSQPTSPSGQDPVQELERVDLISLREASFIDIYYILTSD